jgi:hypothetical protein
MINVFVSYFKAKDPIRRKEIDTAFQKNIENPLIDKLYIFFEKREDMNLFSGSDKVVKLFYPDILTYGEWLKASNDLAEGEVSILINADIYLDQSLANLRIHSEYLKNEKKFIALTRQIPRGSDFIVEPNPFWFQDTWAFVRQKEPIPKALIQESNFELGRPGCDNKIAYIFHSYGYQITNPCYLLRSVHLHYTPAGMPRSHDAPFKERKLLGLHAFVYPTNSLLENSKLEIQLLTRSNHALSSLYINNWINDTPSYTLNIVDWDRHVFEANRENLDPKSAENQPDFFSFENQNPSAAFLNQSAVDVSKLDLVFDYGIDFRIYKDDNDKYYFIDEYWPVLCSVSIDSRKNLDNPSIFYQYFIASWFTHGPLEFSIDPDFEGDTLCWSGNTLDLTKNINLNNYYSGKKGDVVQIFLEFPWATFRKAEKFPDHIFIVLSSRVERIKNILKKYNIALKVYTYISDLDPEFYEEYLKQIGITHVISEHIGQLDPLFIEEKYSSSKYENSLGNVKPIVTIPLYGPEDKYFWRSSRGAFYDMVIEWGRRGFCYLESSDEPGYFWWNGKGNVLLFERDNAFNLRDGKQAPPRWPGNIDYNYAFFANQYGIESHKNFKMFYWSFRPKELENYLINHQINGYKDRKINSLFIGSVENEAQEFFRKKYEKWSHAIEYYYCADKLNSSEASIFTFRGYIEKLNETKFGICMRGNGPKCYREIEYAALGVVPIVLDGVEVDYPEPWIEGEHFLRAVSPAELIELVNSTSEEEWTRISHNVRQWYLRNCTIDALFRLVQDVLEKLPKNPLKYEGVYIEEVDDNIDRCIESLRIFNPTIPILKTSSGNVLQMKSNEIVFSQIPYMDLNRGHQWKITYENIGSLKNNILKSELIENVKLSDLLGWTLNGYIVELIGNQKSLDLSSVLGNGFLKIDEPGISALIRPRYLFDRRLNDKYEAFERILEAPFVFPAMRVIDAKLKYRLNNQDYNSDLTEHFVEYYAKYDELIPESKLFKLLKLWEWEMEDVKLINIELAYILHDGRSQNKVYSDIRWYD